MAAGSIFIALTVFFNVLGTFLARTHSQQEKMWLLAVALASYTAAFVTWSKVLKYFDMGFASSVTTGTILTLSNVIAFVWLNEVYSVSKLFFTCLIVVGVVGVNLSQ